MTKKITGCSSSTGKSAQGVQLPMLIMNRTVIGCPFVAFLVIFSSAMTNNYPDFELLGGSMATLQAIHERSSGIGKLVTACQSFYHVAKGRYAQQAQPATQLPSSTPILMSMAGGYSPQQPVYVGQPDFQEHLSHPSYMAYPEQEDWNQMLDGWELGLGAESARQMTSYFGHYPPASGFMGPST